jgi:hypothetical protein
MRKFVATTESTKLPELLEICQQFCEEQWVADHLDDEGELKLLEIRCEDNCGPG